MADSTPATRPAGFTLSTQRLLLRPWTADDAKAALAIYSDARVMRYLGSAAAAGGAPPVPDLQAMRQRMQKWFETPLEQKGLPGRLAIVEKETDLPIGTVILKHLPDGAGVPTQDVEVGWHLRPDRWGRGYATEAAGAMVVYALEILRMPEVLAVVYKENAASLRVCGRLGMEHLGATDRYYGVTLELFRLRNEPRMNTDSHR